jgi:hypothetical protein
MRGAFAERKTDWLPKPLPHKDLLELMQRCSLTISAIYRLYDAELVTPEGGARDRISGYALERLKEELCAVEAVTKKLIDGSIEVRMAMGYE